MSERMITPTVTQSPFSDPPQSHDRQKRAQPNNRRDFDREGRGKISALARLLVTIALFLALIDALVSHAQAETVRILVGKDFYDVEPWASTLPLRRQFFNQTGIWVEFDAMGTDDTSIVSAAIDIVLRNRDPSIDIFVLDVVWTGQYAADLLPLQDKISPALLALHNEQIVAAGRVMGNLTAVPQQADYGLLYVRTDLLRKYGFTAPPKTMDELGTMLETIVPAERRSNPNFIGYVGQLKPPSYEGFTCNIMEMLHAESAGSILEPNRTLSSIDLTKGTGQHVLRAAHRWNQWNRKGYLAHGLDEWYGMLEFVKGNTLFHRNWPFVVAMLAQFEVTFEWQVAHNPGEAAALGGWMWGVSKYTRQQQTAVRAAEFLMSAEFQMSRLVNAGTLPTVKSMYNDTHVCGILQGQCELFRTIKIAHRPSGASGSQYAEVSQLISKHWTNLVMDLESPPAKLGEHLRAMNHDLGALLNIDVLGDPTNISPQSPIAIAFQAVAAFVMLVSSASLVVFVKSRASPGVSSIGVQSLATMIVGQILMLGVVFALVGVPTPAMCFARVWLFSLGCSVFVPTLGLRAFSIWSRSLNTYMSDQTVPTHALLVLITATIAIDLAILAGFTLANIPTPISTDMLTSRYTRCGTHSPSSITVFYSVLLGYHGLQVVLALAFALSAHRLATLPKKCKHELNLILTSLTNAVVVAVILVPLAVLDYVDQPTGFALQSIAIVAPMGVFSAAYLLPKAWKAMRPAGAAAEDGDANDTNKPMSIYIPSTHAGGNDSFATASTKLNDTDRLSPVAMAPTASKRGSVAPAAPVTATAGGIRASQTMSINIDAMPGVVVLPMSAFAVSRSTTATGSLALAATGGGEQAAGSASATSTVDFKFGKYGVLSVRRAASRRVMFLRPWRMMQAYLLQGEGSLVLVPVSEATRPGDVISVPLDRVGSVDKTTGGAMRVELVAGQCIEIMAAGDKEAEMWVAWVKAACQAAATANAGSPS